MFLWRRKRAGLELGSGSGHCALAHFTAPGHREDPLSKALCATSPTLGPVCCPLHFGRSHAPHPRPTGHRTPRSTGSEVSGKLPAGSPWHAPYPGGKPAAADDPEIVPAPSLELHGAHWPLQGRARRPRPPSAAHTGLRSGQGPSVGPESPSPGRACARAPLPAIMAASASERSRRARSGGRLGARAAGAGRAGARACRPPPARGPQGAKQRAPGSPQHGAPSRRGQAGGAARGRAGGERPGRRARGGAHAGLRGEAQGPGGESAARAARPARARQPQEEGARRRGRRGGAAPCPRPLRAQPGAPRGLVGIPGTAGALTSPQSRGARARGHGRRPRAVSQGCGARRGLASPTLRPLLSRSPYPPPPPRSGGEGVGRETRSLGQVPTPRQKT